MLHQQLEKMDWSPEYVEYLISFVHFNGQDLHNVTRLSSVCWFQAGKLCHLCLPKQDVVTGSKQNERNLNIQC